MVFLRRQILSAHTTGIEHVIFRFKRFLQNDFMLPFFFHVVCINDFVIFSLDVVPQTIGLTQRFFVGYGKHESMRVEIGPIECTLENEMQIGESGVVIQLYIPPNRYADIQKRNPEFEHHLKNHLFCFQYNVFIEQVQITGHSSISASESAKRTCYDWCAIITAKINRKKV